MNVIAHNLLAMNANRQAGIVTTRKSKVSEKLASGYRINRAADDAAGLTISENMRSMIRGLNQGSNNIQDGISLVQIADGALSEVHDMLHRMNELSVKSANGTNTQADRDAIQEEVNNLTKEIDRISKTTTFNTLQIFDDAFGLEAGGSVTKYVSSKSADKGYMVESKYMNGYYYTVANLNFSGINKKNLDFLDDKSFSFTCGYGCGEVFEFTMSTNPSTVDKLTKSGSRYNYTINVAGCTSGAEVADRIYNYVNANPYGGVVADSVPGGAQVAHRQALMKDGSKLVIVDTSSKKSTAAEAENLYPKSYAPSYGAVDASALVAPHYDDLVNEFNIQCSNTQNDVETIRTHRMNAQVLGVDSLRVNSQDKARGAIDTILKAVAKVSSQRSELGAYQNRLETSYSSNQNKAENSQAAESRIRDTDMADAMVDYSKESILLQMGQAMIAQANMSTQGVLSLLG